MVFAKEDTLQPEAASSISSGLSIVGKIIGHGALTIFGHVEGEVRASTIVIAEGAQIEGEVSAEELTIGGYVKGTIRSAPRFGDHRAARLVRSARRVWPSLKTQDHPQLKNETPKIAA